MSASAILRAPCDKARDDASPAVCRERRYPQLLCQETLRHPHPRSPCNAVADAIVPFLFATTILRLAQVRGQGSRMCWQAVDLRMRGQPAAEIRHLRGEAESKTHLLLRRGHSILTVDEVTSDSVGTETEGRSW